MQNMMPIAQTLNCNGRLLSLATPQIMGILNLTPDSFSDGGKYNSLDKALHQAEKMLNEGANIIDIGGYSTRPNALDISEVEELHRIEAITLAIMQRFPEALISIDTFRASVAKKMLENGVHLLNDISGGTLDSEMMATVARFPVPYILMHIQGTPQTMQIAPTYQNIVLDIRDFFVRQIRKAKEAGIHDLILDVGFGFGKTLTDNYVLFKHLRDFQVLGLPLLVGVSRKSMLYKLLDASLSETLPYATALHLQALLSGAKILRVHEVKEAVLTVKLYQQFQ